MIKTRKGTCQKTNQTNQSTN